MNQMPEQVKLGVDIVALSTSMSAIFGLLTTVFGAIGALASAIWLWLRVYETKTVQDWLKRRAAR